MQRGVLMFLSKYSRKTLVSKVMWLQQLAAIHQTMGSLEHVGDVSAPGWRMGPLMVG